jgi:hypothetical protein
MDIWVVKGIENVIKSNLLGLDDLLGYLKKI